MNPMVKKKVNEDTVDEIKRLIREKLRQNPGPHTKTALRRLIGTRKPLDEYNKALKEMFRSGELVINQYNPHTGRPGERIRLQDLDSE